MMRFFNTMREKMLKKENRMNKERDLELLGLKVVDAVTGFTGVVTSISFDLYGCIQGLVVPGIAEEPNKQIEARWFDLKRLKALDYKPVMKLPDFCNVLGGEDLPLP
jgi:hypothetical protein